MLLGAVRLVRSSLQMPGIWKTSLLRSMHSSDCPGSSTVPTHVPSFKAFSTFTGCGPTSGVAALSFQFPFGDHVTFAAMARQDRKGVCVCVCARFVLGEGDCDFFLALEFPIFFFTGVSLG